MSLQDIEVTKVRGESGIKRQIAEGSLNMILDTLQITQYVKPIESTVRELASNAVDSQKEKETAIGILTGKIKKEDIFIEREGEKYKDSKWDASYYDINSLDTQNNEVILTYTKNEGVGFSDAFEVLDYGVGLGMPRLEGYFKLGFSTKRNTSLMLGAYGFGNKVALSTRCDFYQVETVHNGKLFKFNCGSHKFESMISKFNMETEGINDYVIFNEGTEEETVVYYEKTESKNYTKITVPVKRINRDKFEHAVKSQLLYFDNIVFKIVEEDGRSRNVPIKANVSYTSKHLLISDTYLYNKPHIVIVRDTSESSTTGVCYGFVSFEELEMNSLHGPVGFKCPIRQVITHDDGTETVVSEGVSVTPRH
jgi:hypothetical protein